MAEFEKERKKSKQMEEGRRRRERRNMDEMKRWNERERNAKKIDCIYLDDLAVE